MAPAAIAISGGGFRKGRGCPEQLFTLSELVKLRRLRGRSTYACFIDIRKGAISSSANVLDDTLAMIREDAECLDSNAEIDHARTILERGTSADRQIALYQRELARGLNSSAALKSVVDQLAMETVSGAQLCWPSDAPKDLQTPRPAHPI